MPSRYIDLIISSLLVGGVTVARPDREGFAPGHILDLTNRILNASPALDTYYDWYGEPSARRDLLTPGDSARNSRRPEAGDRRRYRASRHPQLHPPAHHCPDHPGRCRDSPSQPGEQDLLDQLIAVYLSRLADGLACRETARLTGTELTFAWEGPLRPGTGHHYRIQGRDLLIEYDNTADGANHAHTVLRHPPHDFGGDALAHPPRKARKTREDRQTPALSVR